MNRTDKFRGCGVALITPFDGDGRVDYAVLEQLLQLHVAQATDFICVLGTTAETPCLTVDEKQHIMQTAVRVVDGRLPLLLGCGGNHTAAVAHELRTLDLSGFDGVLVVTPYYNKPTQEGLYRHYVTVAAASPLPVVLYNVPGRTGVNLEAATTLRIACDCPNVVAVKEASGKLEQIEEILTHKPEVFDVLSGDDALTFDIIARGGQGVISVVANAYPKEFGTMVRDALAGNWEAAKAQHQRFSEFYPLMTVDGNPSGVKALMALQHRIEDVLRLPLVPARTETRQQLEEAMQRF